MSDDTDLTVGLCNGMRRLTNYATAEREPVSLSLLMVCYYSALEADILINSSRRALLLMVVWTAASGSAEPIGRQTPRANNAIADALRTGGGLQSRIRFEHLTSDDGLSHDSVFAILQDRYDFLWIGTQAGLNRYDGNRVTQYRHDPRNAKSLAGDFVQFLFEDSHGGIWAGRNTTRFDPTTETFRRLTFPRICHIIVAVTRRQRGLYLGGA